MSWDPVAAQMHAIPRSAVMKARPAFDVAREINGLLAPLGIAYCDGLRWDLRWLHLLMDECPEPCGFQLGDASGLARTLGLPPSLLLERGDELPTTH